MNIRLSSFEHWRILILSALMLSVAALFMSRKKRPGPTKLVFFSAVERPTITRLLDRLVEDSSHDWDLVHCSFGPRDSRETERYGNSVRWVTPCTWSGARDIASATAIISADRLRTLGIVLRLTSIPFIDVWHGISFKNIKRPQFLSRYAEVWVASDYVAQLYHEKLGVRKSKLKVLGFSPSDPLFQAHDQPRASKSDASSALNVLIAPTWSPRRWSLPSRKKVPFWQDYQLLGKLAVELGVHFTIRAHHLDQGLTKSEDIPHELISFVPQSELPDPSSLLANADVLVTDWSSLAFEYLPTGRPTIFVEDAMRKPRGYLVPASKRWGPVARDRDDLRSALSDVLAATGSEASDRQLKSERALDLFHRDNPVGRSAEQQVARLVQLFC